MDEFLTVAEVAGKLKLNQQTVRNWIDAGSLTAVRAGRRVRIRREDFDRLTSTAAGPAPVPEPPAPSIWDGEVPVPVLPDSYRRGKSAASRRVRHSLRSVQMSHGPVSFSANRKKPGR